MIRAILVALVSASSASGVVEQDGVRIAVQVDSNVYTWQVTNQSAADIVSFDVDARHMYNAAAPRGWFTEIGGDHFRAWTDEPRWALRPGQTERFTATVTVGEAWLGPVVVHLGVAGGDRIAVQGVWGAVRLPRGQIALVALTMVALALLHLWLAPRRPAQPERSDPRGK
jgi:hypothetical protein